MSTVLPADRSAPRRARTWVSAQLNPLGLGPSVHESVVLLVSELVTSVVLHTGSEPVVTLVLDDDQVCVEVDDRTGAVARVLDAGSERLERWGLRIVEELADAWGVGPNSAGTPVVWFSVHARP